MNKTLISETEYEDGSVVCEYEDGSVEIECINLPTSRMYLEDGNIEIECVNLPKTVSKTCTDCNSELWFIDDDGPYEDYPVIHDKCDAFACKDCYKLYICCPDCLIFTRFLGYHNFDYKNKIHLRRLPLSSYELLDDKGDDEVESVEFLTGDNEVKYNNDVSNNLVPYYMGDENLYSIDLDKYDISGQDGSYPHFWKCDSCKKVLEIMEK